MGVYSKIRYAVIKEGMSQRKAAETFGVSRETVRKMQKYSSPPGYRKTKERRSILDPYKKIIEQIIEDDKGVHHKQRHTVVRIFERLKTEYGYPGGLTVVRDYVALSNKRKRETFVPLSHKPGTAEFDFGEADIYLKGIKTRAHYFVMYLPFSDAFFMKCYPVERSESFCDGHTSAFKFFGGIPTTILYDNTSIAVKEIQEGSKRVVTEKFEELVSHYLYCLLYTSPSPRDRTRSRMPSSA